MELTKDTRDRIFAAADSLYEQAGRAAFPTVDAVRKTARVNMNDASAGMKEWRRAQTAQAAPVAVQVPEAVMQASSAALAALWQEAQELANESLRAAQAGWDAERIEADTLNKQMADAFEVQKAELEAGQARITELEAAGRQAAADAEALRQRVEETHAALLAMQQRAAVAEQRAEEIERRAGDLRTELDHAHQEAAQGRVELAGLRQAHAGEIEALRAELVASQGKAEAAAEKASGTIEALRTELATVKAKAETATEAHQAHRKQAAAEAHRTAERMTTAQAERDQARKDERQAREDAATLRGQLNELREQNAQLLQTVKAQSAQSEKPAGKAKKD
ncbi:MAG: KfrA protein [Rhodoferax ferrireducens]|uniref:KfrA protein n=1 Tax=Rhodoferax ferrireducens TaxID=192843 RepID=A0A1W9KR05_9BURK|nr:MAG: KfrA protein [Rhodoferax ferrireducens]